MHIIRALCVSQDLSFHGYFTKPRRVRKQKRLDNNVSEDSFRTTQLTLSVSIIKAIMFIL